MNGGKLGSRSGDLDISGGYETVKCHWACHFPNFRLRSRTVRNCAHERYRQAGSSLAQWNRYNPPRLALPSSGERAALARRKRGAFVRKRVKASFDPKEFLAKVGEGKTISKYRKDQIVFSQGEVADAVFTSSKARSNSPSFPSKARKRWLQSWDQVTFLAKDV